MNGKILLFDVETSPNLGYCWGKWEQNIIKYTKEWEILSYAYKWFGSKSVHCSSRRDYSEKELTISLRDLFVEADIIVAHNGDSFDLKKARTKFLQFGLNPPPISRSVDTKKIAKSQFSFNSNSLNDLGETLGLGKKLDTGGFDLWLGCMSGNKASWGKMIKYNIQDVVLLEKVYLKLRSWNPNHPSMAALKGVRGCPVCGSERVQSNGFRATTKRLQQRWRCIDCGHSYTGGSSVSKR
jgi:DNA polymerase elongation subunit (family B)